MKAPLHSVAITALALAALSLSGFAADKASVNSSDEKFIKEAAAGSKSEVKLGELAAGKAQNADVKAFAQRMVTDHGNMEKEIQSLAKSKGVELSAVVAPDTAKTFQDLETYSGKDFDTQYLKNMESDHKKDISDFESAQKDAKDADLKAWIDKALPTLKDHLAEVQKLQNSTK